MTRHAAALADATADVPYGRSGTVTILARPGVATGFGLASLRCRVVENVAAATSELEHILSAASGEDGSGVAVVLMENDLFRQLPEPTKRRLGRRTLPLVVPFPGPADTEPGSSKDFVAELLRRAIGYRVRLR